jgi:hypothetical protein
MLITLTVDSLLFGVVYPDQGVCEAYQTEAACLEPINEFTNYDLCFWDGLTTSASSVTSTTSQNITVIELVNSGLAFVYTAKVVNDCQPSQPPNSIVFVLVMALMTIVIAIPVIMFYDYVKEDYCNTRPDLDALALNSQFWLGSTNRVLSEQGKAGRGIYDKNDLASMLRRHVEGNKNGSALHGNANSGTRRSSSLSASTSASDSSSGDDALSRMEQAANKSSLNARGAAQQSAANGTARKLYSHFLSAPEEMELILAEARTFMEAYAARNAENWKAPSGVCFVDVAVALLTIISTYNS